MHDSAPRLTRSMHSRAVMEEAQEGGKEGGIDGVACYTDRRHTSHAYLACRHCGRLSCNEGIKGLEAKSVRSILVITSVVYLRSSK